MMYIALLVSLVLTCQASPKARVKDGLSEHDHHKGNEHNPEFDHEAFLGKDEAKTFDELTPDQSKEKLGKLFHKVDTDSDGQVTEDELKEWIKHTQNRYIMEDSEKQMKQNDMNKDGFVTWDEYKKATYGFLDENDKTKSDQASLEGGKRLFKAADANADGRLNSTEYSRLVHPVYHRDMTVILVENMMPHLDPNNDTLVSFDEYTKFITPPFHKDIKNTSSTWLDEEKKAFKDLWDKNNDGNLDIKEISEWMYPNYLNLYRDEAKHLIDQADEDLDYKVSKKEMLKKYEVFAGSSVTFNPTHSEL